MGQTSVGQKAEKWSLFWSLNALLLMSTFSRISEASLPFALKTFNDCNSTEFYDVSRLRCEPCGVKSEEPSVNQGKDADNASKSAQTKSLETKSEDGFSCICSPGSFRVPSHELECKACPSGEVTSFDGFGCSKCEPPLTFNNKTKRCLPCSHGVRVEITSATVRKQYCQPCPDLTELRAETGTCIPCHQSFTRDTNIKNCSCPKDGFKVYGDICIPNEVIVPEKQTLEVINYENDVSVRSAFFARNLQAAVYNCRQARNRTACQLLGNLCVLLLYSFHDKNQGKDTNACMEYRILMEDGSFSGQIWPKGAPWLYYGTEAKAELTKTNVPNRFTLNSKLTLYAFRYNAEGKLVDVSELASGELQLCRESSRSSDSGLIFGTNFDKTCSLSARELWRRAPKTGTELLFYDLFLLSSDSDGKQLYPVPVLIRNLRKNDVLINGDAQVDNWQLVRRFYLSEALTSIEVKSADQVKGVQDREFGNAKVVRFVKSLEIDVNMRERDGYIYPPLLIISYAEITRDDHKKGTEVDISFRIIYSMDMSKVEQDVSISLAVLCCLAALWSMFRTWTTAKRSGRQAIDPVTVGKFLIINCGVLANVFFVVNTCVAIHWFLIYKKQSEIHTLLPTPEQESSMRVYLTIAFVLKVFHIIHELAVCCNVNIFFIDWERPRSRGAVAASGSNKAKSAGSSSRSLASENQEKAESETSLTRGAHRGGASLGKSGQEKLILAELPSVSIWRTYFVANEWIKLLCRRRLNLAFHVLLVILFLNTFGLENLSTSDTQNEVRRTESQLHVPLSSSCRVAIGSLVYLFLALAQILFKKLLYERLVENKLNEFVDLCSVSNVSVFCVLYQNFGFYVHGRSANGRADVNMKEMHELLKREEDDLCSKRGLVPNTDQQTFEMALPSAINEQYQRMRSTLTAYSQGADRMQGVGGHLSRVDIEKVVPTYLMINKFLSGFIEHAFKDIAYTVKEKTTLEAILDTEFSDTRESGFLYNDNGHSFEGALFYGLEFTLLSFEIMLFVVIDLAADDFTFAAILTFMIAEVIEKTYLSAARKNLVKKALVDERFLV